MGQAEEGSGLQHKAIPFCARGIKPSQLNKKEVLCDKPTVFYGSKSQLANCETCGHTSRKYTYLISIEQHIQVDCMQISTPLPSCMRSAWSRHEFCQQTTRPISPSPACVLLRQNLWNRRDLRQDLQRSFREWRPRQPGEEQTDVVHSRKFEEYCGGFVGGEGYRNVVLMLYADGVSVAQRRENSMFIISAQVVNLPPDKRRQLSNMLLLQIIPGPKTPKSIYDLLQPLIDELKSLYTTGVAINVGEEAPVNIKAMFVTIVADSRAHPKLTFMMQTPAIYPCHLCMLEVSTQHSTLHTRTPPCNPLRHYMTTT